MLKMMKMKHMKNTGRILGIGKSKKESNWAENRLTFRWHLLGVEVREEWKKRRKKKCQQKKKRKRRKRRKKKKGKENISKKQQKKKEKKKKRLKRKEGKEKWTTSKLPWEKASTTQRLTHSIWKLCHSRWIKFWRKMGSKSNQVRSEMTEIAFLIACEPFLAMAWIGTLNWEEH